jgi:hypothetical protein
MKQAKEEDVKVSTYIQKQKKKNMHSVKPNKKHAFCVRKDNSYFGNH